MSERFERGLAMRRQVMGDAHVERAFASATGFSLPLQEFMTEHAWGTVWCRDGIDLKTRSLITVAMLAALGRGADARARKTGGGLLMGLP